MSTQTWATCWSCKQRIDIQSMHVWPINGWTWLCTNCRPCNNDRCTRCI